MCAQSKSNRKLLWLPWFSSQLVERKGKPIEQLHSDYLLHHYVQVFHWFAEPVNAMYQVVHVISKSQTDLFSNNEHTQLISNFQDTIKWCLTFFCSSCHSIIFFPKKNQFSSVSNFLTFCGFTCPNVWMFITASSAIRFALCEVQVDYLSSTSYLWKIPQ